MDHDYRALRRALRGAARAAGALPRDARRQPRRLAAVFVDSHVRAEAARDVVAAMMLASLAELASLVAQPRSSWSRREFAAWDRAAGRAYHGAQLARRDDTPLGRAFLLALRAAADAAYAKRV